jgi:hypothetical protein
MQQNKIFLKGFANIAIFVQPTVFGNLFISRNCFLLSFYL